MTEIKYNNNKVKEATVYTQPRCTWCVRVKKLLEDNGYVVREEDAADNTELLESLLRGRLRSVPQVTVEGYGLIGGYEEVKTFLGDTSQYTITQNT